MRIAKDEEEMEAIEAEEFGRIARNVARDMEGLKIISFEEEKLQIELSLKAQFDFSFDAGGTADYTVSITPDTGQIIRSFLRNVEKHMERISISEK